MITTIVATCGTDWWRTAGDQAAETVHGPVVRVHDPHGTVAGVRNAGLDLVGTSFVCWLDADDSLTPDYLDRMAEGTADIRQPSVRGWGPFGPPQCRHHGEPHGATRECLRFGNPFSPGAVVRTDLARQHPWDGRWPVLEDFAFWRTICADHRVTVECISSAVYQARTIRHRGHRNRSLPRAEWEAVARRIIVEVPFP